MSNLDEKYLNCINYCFENNIQKIVMFIKEPQNIIEINKHIKKKDYNIDLIAVTFPSNEVLYIVNDENEVEEIIPTASNGDSVKEILLEMGIKYISSSLPFEGIVIPGENYNPYKIIEQSFDLIYKGLSNAIQAALMATDNGYIMPQERVLAINSSLATDLHGSNARYLFHPDKGLVINKVIKF